jgi:hypothetical protein
MTVRKNFVLPDIFCDYFITRFPLHLSFLFFPLFLFKQTPKPNKVGVVVLDRLRGVPPTRRHPHPVASISGRCNGVRRHSTGVAGEN